MSNNKEKLKVIQEAENRGWYLHRSNKHLIYKHKKGGCVTISSTKSKGHETWKGIKQDFIRQERLYHN